MCIRDRIQTASIDLVDNKIEIGIIEPDKLNIIYEGLSAIDGMYSVTILDPEEDVFHDIAVINGTSRISNGTSSVSYTHLRLGFFTVFSVHSAGKRFLVLRRSSLPRTLYEIQVLFSQ